MMRALSPVIHSSPRQKRVVAGNGWTNNPAPPVPVAQLRQNIASVAHLYGVRIIRNGLAIAEMPACEFGRLVKAAVDGAGKRRADVDKIIRSIAGHIRSTPGPLSVHLDYLNRLKGVARGSAREEKAEGLRVVRSRRRADDRGPHDSCVGPAAADPAHPDLRSAQGAGLPKVQRSQGTDAAGDIRRATPRRARNDRMAQGVEPACTGAGSAPEPACAGVRRQPHAGAGAPVSAHQAAASKRAGLAAAATRNGTHSVGGRAASRASRASVGAGR